MPTPACKLRGAVAADVAVAVAAVVAAVAGAAVVAAAAAAEPAAHHGVSAASAKSRAHSDHIEKRETLLWPGPTKSTRPNLVLFKSYPLQVLSSSSRVILKVVFSPSRVLFVALLLPILARVQGFQIH